MKLLLPSFILVNIQVCCAWLTSVTPSKLKISSLHATSNTPMITFSKYEGLGNDFILIDNRSSTQPSLTPEESAKLCNRNFGIGADGVIFALSPPSPEYDFSMRIYNSDGSEPEMCGNGIRCFAAFLRDIGENSKKSLNIHTLAGKIVPVLNDDGTVTVDMGSPILEGARIPTTLVPNADMNSVVDQTLACNQKEWKVTCVSMGNPHCVIFVNDLEKDFDLFKDGPLLETHAVFPAKTNVEFVQVISDQHLKMKVWERGAGPTLACGTGACALTVAAIRAKKIPRPNGVEGTKNNAVRVTLPGGDLFIEWRQSNNKIYMSGPANISFMGKAVLK